MGAINVILQNVGPKRDPARMVAPNNHDWLRIEALDTNSARHAEHTKLQKQHCEIKFHLGSAVSNVLLDDVLVCLNKIKQ